MPASIWDFFFSFDADTDGVQKGIRDTERQTNRLKGALNDVDNVAGEVFGHLRDVGGQLVGMAAGVFAIGSLIGSIQETVQFSLEMGTLAQRAGLAVETFGALTDEARQLGGAFTESEMFSALERLQTETDDVYGTLERFQQLAAGLSTNEALNLGDSLGIDPVLVNVLQQADMSLANLTDRYVKMGGLTDEGLGALRSTYQAWNELRQMWSNSVREIAVELGPGLTAVIGYLKDIISWARENSTTVGVFFTTLAGIVTAIYLPAMIKAAIATTAATWPFLAIAAAIAAVSAVIALVVDDFLVFQRGGESVIGRLVERFPALGAVIEAIGFYIEYVRNVMGGLITLVSRLGEVFDAFVEGGIVAAMQKLGELFKDFFSGLGEAYPQIAIVFDLLGTSISFIIDMIGRLIAVGWELAEYFVKMLYNMFTLFIRPREAIQGLQDAITGLFDGLFEIFPEVVDVFKTIGDLAGGVADSIGNFFSNPFGGDTSIEATQRVAHEMAGAQNSLLGAQALAAGTRYTMSENQTTMNTVTTQNTRNVNTGPVNINIQSDDPDAVAREVQKAIDDLGGDLDAETRTGIQ